MLMIRNSLCRPPPSQRIGLLHQLFRNQRYKDPVQAIRFKSTVPATKKPTDYQTPIVKRKTLYPERLLVFHAGAFRSSFIGMMKVGTIFTCAFFTLVAAPRVFWAEPEEGDEVPWQQPWVGVVVALSGIIPLAFVAYTTAPFVNFVHMRVPPFARNSKDLMMRYSKNLPKDAELDFTCMNFIGQPRVIRVKASRLYPAKERFGMVNYVRDTKEINEKRPWYMGKARRQLGVYKNMSKIMDGDVWDNIAGSLARNRS